MVISLVLIITIASLNGSFSKTITTTMLNFSQKGFLSDYKKGNEDYSSFQLYEYFKRE